MDSYIKKKKKKKGDTTHFIIKQCWNAPLIQTRDTKQCQKTPKLDVPLQILCSHVVLKKFIFLFTFCSFNFLLLISRAFSFSLLNLKDTMFQLFTVENINTFNVI